MPVQRGRGGGRLDSEPFRRGGMAIAAEVFRCDSGCGEPGGEGAFELEIAAKSAGSRGFDPILSRVVVACDDVRGRIDRAKPR